MTIRLLKLKRRLSTSPPPDLLVLDGPVDPKRSKTDLNEIIGNDSIAVFQRVSSAPAYHYKCPEGRLKPNLTSIFSSLSFSDEADADTEEGFEVVEEREEENVVFDFYILQENVDLVAVDLASIDRVYIPEEELILLCDTSDEGSGYSDDDDSNAESYYQNDYPDECDSSGLSDLDYDCYHGKDEDYPYHRHYINYGGEEDDEDEYGF